MYKAQYFPRKIYLYKKQKSLLQSSVCELKNDLILPVTKDIFISAYDNGGKVYIGDTSLLKYTPKQKNPKINRKKTYVDVKNLLVQYQFNLA